ncbi:MAG: Gfo/Idh/MocA family oxidoreductase [Roseburia sp.]|nr:Gfo/Idh/MocA family oxidoreductase [Roseburia sp.]
MKVLFIGLGSAGQRHMRNLKRILGDEAEFIAYRVRKLERLFDDNLNIVEGQRVADAYHIREFYSLEEALNDKPEIAVISNPNSMHIKCALQVAERGIDIFLEKPVSDTLEGVNELENVAREKGIVVYVGYQMRLHPCVRRLKKDIDADKIGRIVSVSCHMGELITRMHKYEDYRGMNEAKKSTGGGVVLCQIHELDYLYWIFGMPKEVYSIGGKCSNLEIEVEDAATTFCRYEKNGYEYPIVIHQDFLQSPAVRKCRVVGTKGQVEMDLLENEYTLYSEEAVIEERFVNFVRNDMFMEEMKLFLKYVQDRRQESLTLEDGIGSLKIALAIKDSMANGTPVQF